MGRGNSLSKEEEAVVVARWQDGHSQRTIAGKLGKSKTAVHNCIMRYQLGPRPEQRGRPKLWDERVT
jgi:transposase